MQLTLQLEFAQNCVFFCERSCVVLCTCCFFQRLETRSHIFFLIRISDAYDTHHGKILLFYFVMDERYRLRHPVSATKIETELYFLGNVLALDAPSIPLLWLFRLLARVDTAAVFSISTAFGTPIVTCGLPCTIADATALALDDPRDARRRRPARAHVPDMCCYAMGA